jgi:Peptidase family M23
MARRRWTILVVPHDAAGTRILSVSSTALLLAAGAAAAVAASLFVAAFGVISHSVGLSRAWQLERDHGALAAEVGRLGRRADGLADRLAVLSRRDDELRLAAGLQPLTPGVKAAGIGGPVEPWPERDRLLTEAGTVGREAFGVHTDLDALIRQANIIATASEEAADSAVAHHRELAATPTIMPTEGFITSLFSAMRFHPILHVVRPHEGLDITAAWGNPVVAPAAGRVVRVGRDGGYGLLVEIDHGYGLQTRYAHLSRIAVRDSEWVKRGDVVGYIGSTGLSTGPHLHYEVRLNGRPVNPLKYILPEDYTD